MSCETSKCTRRFYKWVRNPNLGQGVALQPSIKKMTFEVTENGKTTVHEFDPLTKVDDTTTAVDKATEIAKKKLEDRAKVGKVITPCTGDCDCHATKTPPAPNSNSWSQQPVELGFFFHITWTPTRVKVEYSQWAVHADFDGECSPVEDEGDVFFVLPRQDKQA